MEQSVRSWPGRPVVRGLRALLLGVTPEIAAMAWPDDAHLTAIDRSEAMIEHVWPGDIAGRRTVRQADWFACDYGSNDIVICDGVFAIMRYPDQYVALVRKIATSLAEGGFFVTRTFLQAVVRETPANVLRDLVDGKIGSVHAFKFRLAMSMQPSAAEGVRHADVFDAAQKGGIDCDTLSARTGWSEIEIDTLRLYRDKDTRLSFPTASEMASVMAEHFETIGESRSDYEMGDRCPVLTYRRR